MPTVLAGAAALFAIVVAGVAALNKARRLSLGLCAAASVLALAAVAMAVIGNAAYQRCVDDAPSPYRTSASMGDATPESVAAWSSALADCQSRDALGIHSP